VQKNTGNPERRENTKQVRDQGMLEELQSIGTVMGSKKKESGVSGSYLRKETH